MMAYSRTKGGTPRVNANKEVRRVRARFAQALNLGHPKHVAAKLASGEEEIAPASPAPESVRQEEIRRPATDTAKIAGSPSVKPEMKIADPEKAKVVRNDVPPNWQDLPWPDLRKLASQFSGGINPASRKEASEIISKAIES